MKKSGMVLFLTLFFILFTLLGSTCPVIALDPNQADSDVALVSAPPDAAEELPLTTDGSIPPDTAQIC